MRPAEVFVRSLAHDEAVRLKRLSTRAKHKSTRIRAAILLASNVRMSVPEIARMWLTDDSHVRKVIHEFNERRFDSLDPDYRGGRPRRITPDQRQRVVAVAGARPDTQGVPLTRWSLDRLAVWLAGQGIVEVSPAHLARLLEAAGLSFQRTRFWKASPDPDYQAKAERVLALYAAPPQDGPVISFDQMGPISLRPTQGAGWAARGRPERLRATYNRRHGIRYVFGALDVHADHLRAFRGDPLGGSARPPARRSGHRRAGAPPRLGFALARGCRLCVAPVAGSCGVACDSRLSGSRSTRTVSRSVPMRRTTGAFAAGIARWRARGSSSGTTWAVPVRHRRPILIRTLGSAWMLRT